MVPEFQEKRFVSITKGKIDLEKYENDKKTKKQESKDKEKGALDFDKLIKKIKTELGDTVSDVRISNKLVDSPSCLVADEVGMDVQMERIMKMHDKDFAGMPRILELNENHPLLLKLNKIHEKDENIISDAAHMLLDQAKILEGQIPSDLTNFSKRLTGFMTKSLK